MTVFIALLFTIVLGYIALMGFKINHAEKQCEKTRSKYDEKIDAFNGLNLKAGDRIILKEDYIGNDIIIRKGNAAAITEIPENYSLYVWNDYIIVSFDGFSFEVKIPKVLVEREK